MDYFSPAKENELQLDLDTKQSQRSYRKRLQFLKRLHHFKVLSIRMFTSNSGNKHVSILLDRKLPIMERIALQAALGSDPIREMCNIGRVKNNAPFPVLFVHRFPRNFHRKK